MRWGLGSGHSGPVFVGLWMLLVAIQLPILFPILAPSMIDVVAAPGALCPSAGEVSAKLQALSPDSPALPPRGRDVVTLDEDGGLLRVTLRAADGTVLGQRTFDRGHPCGDLASAVAVAVASWESDVHPEFVPALPRSRNDGATSPPGLPLTAVTNATASDAAVATTGATPTIRQGRVQAPASMTTTEGPAPSLDVGAALIAQLAPGRLDGALDTAVAPGLAVGAGWVPGGRGLGVRLAVGTTTARTAPLSDGEARWRRVTVAAGPQLRWSTANGRTTLDFQVAALAAALHLRGVGFWTNQNEWSLDVGGAAATRMWLGTGDWRPSIEVSVLLWPREHVLHARPSEATSTLPRVEALLSLGLALVLPKTTTRPLEQVAHEPPGAAAPP